MATETERKFLVRDSSYKELAFSHSRIRQGYICRESGRTVRVRTRDDRAYLTIKGPRQADGLSHYEFEKEIAMDEACELMKLCLPGMVDKTRWLVRHAGHVFEVDEFYGDNQGLVMAEVELKRADEPVELPAFIGKEVTADRRYYNSRLCEHPFCQWGGQM